MTTRSPRVVVLALLAVLAAAAGTAAAGLGREAADRAFVAPLRQLDLGARLDGRADAAEAVAAGARLPERCRGSSFDSRCDDDLRCAWLAARAAVAAAWPAGPDDARRAAAAALDHAADRLARSGTCGSDDSERERWRADRGSAIADAARVRLAELAAARDVPGPLPADQGDVDRVTRLVARARRSGVASIGDAELIPSRLAIRHTAERTAWLGGQPALAALRAVVHDAWATLGGVPQGCGSELFQGHLLADEWRGLLVTGAVPRALTCLSGRYEMLVRSRGARVADARAARARALELARRAGADDGGRTFGQDARSVREIASLAAAISIVVATPSPVPAAPPASRPEPRAAADRLAASAARPEARRTVERGARDVVPRPGDAGPAATGIPADRGTRTPSTRAPEAPVVPPARTGADDEGTVTRGELVAFASRAVALLGRDRGLRGAAARAGTREQREKVLERIYVEVHRELCSPLERLDPADREAAVRVLGPVADDAACGLRDEREATERLLAGATGLARFRAAADLRRAARLVASGHEQEALRIVDALPETMRGTTWALVRAWALRRAGDHAAASRALAVLDESLVDRLRTAGDEALARLAAHAFVSPHP